ncbi:MAG TPA: glycosyltransferase family 2 protein [Solirubrobacteraceae bacterium]|jgi:dTDP-L-rhamnose 4-epimerase|nr:glycosyltransferase family 2 protein [Solirubrobacteraceae bacterium]
MTPATTVDVILPVLDEAGAIPLVLGAMPPGYRAIVVDNGSSDGSGEIAARLGALVVEEPRRGFGAACHAGLRAAAAEIVCMMDCDGSFDPRELPALVAPVAGGRADLALGARRPAPGSWPAHARLANMGLAALLRARAGVKLRDLGPMRAAHRQALLDLAIADRAFGYPLEMVLRAAAREWRIVELPVSYRPRTGASKVTGTLRGSARAVRDMSRLLAGGVE